MPGLTPDEVKATLIATSQRLPAADPQAQGAGLIDVAKAIAVKNPRKVVQDYWKSSGLGSIQAAAGSWTDTSWSGNRWSGNRWSGGTWSGGTWSGGTWSGGTWSGGTWSGGTWSGGTWSTGSWGSAP